jgi:15-cis-phytoene desaturase
MAGPDKPIKLPKQNRVSPEEYKEFLSLGHGDIFDLDLDRCGAEGRGPRV